MTYVMSDIFGEYEKYRAMLEKISFKNTDVLYILGNIIDYGEGGIEILTDMSYRANVIPVIGEHEYMALKVLGGLVDADNAPSEKLKANLQEWLSNGGQTTMNAFMQLSQDEKEGIVEYLEEFSGYEVVQAGGETFVLVHAGLSDFAPDKDLYDYSIDQLIFEGADYNKKYFDDKTLVTGHTPTYEINEAMRGKIIKQNGHIAIDCGVFSGETLGCICLENGKEFYVE